jgi:hypothetical protein
MRLDSAAYFKTNRAGLPIGDFPGYFAPLIPDLAIGGFPELLMVAQAEPLSRALWSASASV